MQLTGLKKGERRNLPLETVFWKVQETPSDGVLAKLNHVEAFNHGIFIALEDLLKCLENDLGVTICQKRKSRKEIAKVNLSEKEKIEIALATSIVENLRKENPKLKIRRRGSIIYLPKK